MIFFLSNKIRIIFTTNGQMAQSETVNGIVGKPEIPSTGPNAVIENSSSPPKNGDNLDEKNTDSSDVTLLEIPNVPDGSYGWIIVFASFMCNLILDGIAYSFGVFLPVFVKEFNSGKGALGWAPSIIGGVAFMIGPIASAFISEFGCRLVCIVGGIIGSLGIGLAALSPNLAVFLVLYGFIGGIGFGLVYLPAIVSVSYYFESKRAFATGLAVCGSGVGTFIFAPLSGLLLTSMSWKMVYLIFSATVLSCSGLGVLMRPLKMQKIPVHKIASELEIDEGNNERRQSVKSNQSNNSKVIDQKSLPKIKIIQSGPIESISQESATSRKPQLKTHNSAARSALLVPGFRKDIFYSRSVENLPEYQNRASLILYRQSVLITPKESKENSSGDMLVSQNEQEDASTTMHHNLLLKWCSSCRCHSQICEQVLAEMTDFSLLRDPVFVCIAMSNIFGMLAFDIPFVYIYDAAKIKKVEDSDSAFLLSIMGIANIVGRILFGLISDIPQVNSSSVNNSCLLMSGICVLLIPLCKSYYSFIAVSFLFGLFSSGYIALSSIILVDLLGLEKLTNAYGLLTLFRGVASLVGAPIAGALYDAFDEYDQAFWVAGGFFLVSAVIGFCIPFVTRFAPPKTDLNGLL